MTITNTIRSVTYTGNDSTTVFPYTFIIPDTDSVLVQLVEIATNDVTVLNSSQYSITGINDSGGGNVTYPTAGSPLSPEFQIQIVRVTVPIQEVSVNNQSAYDADVVEGVWDRLTMMNQDNFDDLDRALLAPFGQSGTTVFPGSTDEVLIYNSDGNIVGGPTANEITNAQGYATAAAASATAAAQSFSDFETRYLGAKAADPTLDNEGNALIDGALYFNTTANEMRVYDLGGTVWIDVLTGALVASNNLSDLTNDSIARTNLGVDIGSDVQAHDDLLDDISAITPAAGSLIYYNGSNYVDLGIGSANQMLRVNSGGTAPEWVNGSGLVFIERQVASNDSSIDFTSLDSSLYDGYELYISKALPSSDGAILIARTSTDGGSSYDDGASDYFYAATSRTGGGDTGYASTASFAQLTFAVGNVGAQETGVSGRLSVHGPHLSNRCDITFETASVLNTGSASIVCGMATRDTNADVDAFRIFFSVGNVTSGIFTLYGRRNS